MQFFFAILVCAGLCSCRTTGINSKVLGRDMDDWRAESMEKDSKGRSSMYRRF